MDKLNGAIHTIWYTKDKEELGSGHIFRQTSLALVVLHLADTLVKHGQANPYTDIKEKKTTRCGFSLAWGQPQARHFSHTLARFLPPNGLWEDFPCNGKQSAWTLKGTASDYK